mgnify:CR=1 FL=1
MSHNYTVSTATVIALWNNWALAFGAISVVMLAPLIISKNWLPLLLYAEAYVLSLKLKASFDTKKRQTVCNLILRVAMLIIFWSATVMLAINLLQAEWFFGRMMVWEPFNPEHPYICSLIVFPTALIVCGYTLLMGHNLKFCQNCQARYGYYPGDGIIATLYYRESRNQVKLMLWLSLALTMIDWAYYYFFYINVNYNTPDRFYFTFMPAAIYLFSLVYMGVRYMNMADRISEHATHPDAPKPMMTMVRFLIFSGDSVFLAPNTDELFDTPARINIPRRESLELGQARADFERIAGIKDFEIKFMYANEGYVNGANVLHYAVFLNDETMQMELIGLWLRIDEIDRMLRSGGLAPMLLNEIYRIYNVTMAWKTYDRDGRRIYPIKNYHPTFRLRDLRHWDVDYNDLHWLQVVTNNEDRPFYRLRRFWRKLFRIAP